MDRLQISSTGFPGTNKTWRFLQNALGSQIQNITAMLGDDVILTGAVLENGEVSDGFIIHDGEILPLEGGSYTQNIEIVEVVENVAYNIDINDDTLFDDLPAYVTRYARFTDIQTTFNYEQLTRLQTLKAVMNSIFSGAYADLSGLPTLFSGAYADLSGLPALFSGAYADLSGLPALANVATSGDYADLSGLPNLGKLSYLNQFTDPESLLKLGCAGIVGYSGSRGWYRGKDRVLDGVDYFPFASRRLATGKYRITHNLGTTAYGFVGSGVDATNIKASMYNKQANYCDVGTSDDNTLNNSSFSFLIFKFY